MSIRAPLDIMHVLVGDGIATAITFDLKIFKTFPFDLTLVSPSSVIATDLTGTPPLGITATNSGTSVTLTFAAAFNGNKRVGLSIFFG